MDTSVKMDGLADLAPIRYDSHTIHQLNLFYLVVKNTNFIRVGTFSLGFCTLWVHYGASYAEKKKSAFYVRPCVWCLFQCLLTDKKNGEYVLYQRKSETQCSILPLFFVAFWCCITPSASAAAAAAAASSSSLCTYGFIRGPYVARNWLSWCPNFPYSLTTYSHSLSDYKSNTKDQ